MKKIVIHQKNSNTLILEDDNIDNLNVYTKEFSKVMESSKICIVEITSGNVILKPSEISSVIITDSDNSKNKINEKKIFNSKDVLKD